MLYDQWVLRLLGLTSLRPVPWSELTRGMTVADWWGVTKRPANATWIRDIDADGYFALLTERLARL